MRGGDKTMDNGVQLNTYYHRKIVAITVSEHYVHKGMYSIKGLGVTYDKNQVLRWKVLDLSPPSRKCWPLEKVAMSMCMKHNIMYVSHTNRGSKVLQHNESLLDSVKPLDAEVYQGLLTIELQKKGI